jgi:diguanylate cyclase (GGDEF)-like protein
MSNNTSKNRICQTVEKSSHFKKKQMELGYNILKMKRKGLFMQYNLSKILLGNEDIVEEFMDTYTACVKIEGDEKIGIVTDFYKQVFALLGREFEEEEIVTIFAKLAEYKISLDIPYTIMSNEVYGLENILILKMSQNIPNKDLLQLIKLFKRINNKVAHIYLLKYIDKLVSLNSIRRNSLHELVGKNLMNHYESHLVWLSDLAQHIKYKEKKSFPEVDDKLCDFGKWLHGEAKRIIQNNSKYKVIDNLHKNLHLFAKKIYRVLGLGEYHILITYLEKCELISLSIGTELALLDHMMINKKIAKDTLTGALNRYSIHTLFENEYELALATGSSFVLAMCDLDYFKQINDKYGHVAGDYVLKTFVDIVKSTLRGSDVIIRYGGEEFIIMLPAINQENGLKVLEKIRERFAQTTVSFQDKEIHATVSIGMMEIHPTQLYKKYFLDEYIMMVDQKLYNAKANGRNKIEYL